MESNEHFPCEYAFSVLDDDPSKIIFSALTSSNNVIAPQESDIR